jgi:glycosyltransferase involved in cell wall biosynthesis
VLAVIGDGEDVVRLRNLADALGLGASVRWLGPIYEEAAVAPWFMNAECFVYPGPIGLSLLQAFGYGLPVLTHDRRREHNPEIAALEDGRNGLLFPRGDPEALAGCIRRIGSESGLREALGAEARRTVELRYSTELMVERFLAAVRTASELVSRPQRPAVRASASL